MSVLDVHSILKIINNSTRQPTLVNIDPPTTAAPDDPSNKTDATARDTDGTTTGDPSTTAASDDPTDQTDATARDRDGTTTGEVQVDSLKIGSVDTLTYTAGGSGQTVSVTLSVTENGGASTNGEVTKISIYFTNSDAFEASTTVKSGAFDHTLQTPETVTAGATVTNLAADVPSVLIDTANCQVYTHVCAVITATDDTNTSDDLTACLLAQPSILKQAPRMSR
ncbi:uncharacterized protein [Ptychodera flava]|uniref:uncharacterized protein n=1 Tax=Ptychodera flava TaxID=63121 RepID=UPI00396A9759